MLNMNQHVKALPDWLSMVPVGTLSFHVLQHSGRFTDPQIAAGLLGGSHAMARGCELTGTAGGHGLCDETGLL